MHRRILCWTFLLVCAPSARGSTLHVPTSEFPSVQAAIDSSASGDTLLLASGVYEENPRVYVKDLTIRSAPGGLAILDAAPRAGEDGNAGCVLRSVHSALVIEDLVLRNGLPVTEGAGLWVWGGHVEVRRCRFENNVYGVLVFEPIPGTVRLEECEFVGNGIGVWGFVSTTIERCRFVNNWIGLRLQGRIELRDVEVTGSGAPWKWGAPSFNAASLLLVGATGMLERVAVHHNSIPNGLPGIWLEVGPYELVDCSSSYNDSQLGPSGIACVRVTDLTMRRCVASYNTSRGPAPPIGGLFADRSHVRAEQCRFEFNDSGGNGSGICALRNATVEMTGGRIVGNRAEIKGGGVYASAARVHLDSVLVAGNMAQAGAALALDRDGEVQVQRSTLVANVASGGAAALYNVGGVAALEQSIVAFNTGSPVLVCAGDLTRRCTDVFGNSDDGACGRDLGGNLSVDPEFCGFEPERGVYDVRLAEGSPLVAGAACDGIGAAGPGCTSTTAQAITWSAAKRLFR